MGRFVISKTATGFRFDLKAANGESVAASEVYETENACRKGIDSVRRAAAKAKLADLTDPAANPVTNPKFELFTDKAGQYRFRLRARNGEIIAVSESYGSKAACLHGIESVRTNAAEDTERGS